MEVIDTILRQLGDLENVNAVRAQIVALILDQLQSLQHSLGDWEKTHFMNAIGALALNVNSLRQPTTAWLRLCLVDLEKALTPPANGNEQYLVRDAAGEEIGYEQLLEALDSVGRKLRLPHRSGS